MWSSSPTARPFLGLAKVTRAAHRASAREVNDARRLRRALHMINVIQKKNMINVTMLYDASSRFRSITQYKGQPWLTSQHFSLRSSHAHLCTLHLYFDIPAQLFADPCELDHRRGSYTFERFGAGNLEAPVFAPGAGPSGLFLNVTVGGPSRRVMRARVTKMMTYSASRNLVCALCGASNGCSMSNTDTV